MSLPVSNQENNYEYDRSIFHDLPSFSPETQKAFKNAVQDLSIPTNSINKLSTWKNNAIKEGECYDDYRLGTWNTARPAIAILTATVIATIVILATVCGILFNPVLLIFLCHVALILIPVIAYHLSKIISDYHIEKVGEFTRKEFQALNCELNNKLETYKKPHPSKTGLTDYQNKQIATYTKALEELKYAHGYFPPFIEEPGAPLASELIEPSSVLPANYILHCEIQRLQRAAA